MSQRDTHTAVLCCLHTTVLSVGERESTHDVGGMSFQDWPKESPYSYWTWSRNPPQEHTKQQTHVRCDANKWQGHNPNMSELHHCRNGLSATIGHLPATCRPLNRLSAEVAGKQ